MVKSGRGGVPAPRMVTGGDVIVVRPRARREESAAPQTRAPAAVRAMAPAVGPGGTIRTDATRAGGTAAAPYTSAPPVPEYEFGTWRRLGGEEG